MAEAGKSRAEIAEDLELSPNYLSAFMAKHGITEHHNRQGERRRRCANVVRLPDGRALSEVMLAHGVTTKQAVYYRVRWRVLKGVPLAEAIVQSRMAA